MALRFDWSQLSSQAGQALVVSAINAVIAQHNAPLQGGFAFIESLELGSSPPVFALTDIAHLSDDGASAEAKLHFSYSGEARIVARVYAQINTTRSQRGRVGDRGRLLFRSLDSFAPAYLNVWACVSHVEICADATLSLIPAPTPAIRVRFASFPLRHVSLSTCFDGSVISETIRAGIGGAVATAKEEFSARGLAVEVPLGALPAAGGAPSAAGAAEAIGGTGEDAKEGGTVSTAATTAAAAPAGAAGDVYAGAASTSPSGSADRRYSPAPYPAPYTAPISAPSPALSAAPSAAPSAAVSAATAPIDVT